MTKDYSDHRQSLSISNLLQHYKSGRFTPVDIVETLVELLQDENRNCNAMVSVDFDLLRQQAEESTNRWKNQSPVGVLDGIPIAVKDVLDVVGFKTQFGSPAMRDVQPALKDCEAVRRLRAAGALIIGKSRTWEFAWRSNPERPAEEVVRNPRNQNYSTGGSSSGSAAAVAAGLCSIALGTDSGGSVRGPAAYCGVVGLKAGHGCIPVVPPSPMGEFEHIGIIGTTVEDCALAMNIVAGYHADDDSSWPYSQHTIDVNDFQLKDIKAVFSSDLNYAKPHSRSVNLLNTAIEQLKKAGLQAKAVDIDFPKTFDVTDMLYDENGLDTVDLVEENKRYLIDDEILDVAMRASTRLSTDYQQARKIRKECCQVFNRLFESANLLMTLTQESTANHLDQPASMMKYTRCFDMTGQPAISIPIGTGENDLPVGMQLIAAKGNEDFLLKAAHWIENQLGIEQ